MTLNIAVAHPECVYVAADFRLSMMVRGRGTLPMDEPSMKVVQFVYPRCSGVITYTGFGKGRDGADTAVHVTRWLAGLRDLDVADVAEVLRNKGDRWLALLRPFPFRHTFLVAGFRGAGEGVLAMVSNFQSMNGPTQDQPSRSLAVSVEATRNRPLVRVTGVGAPAVPRERQRLLKRTVEINPVDSARVRQVMTSLIARAASSPAVRDGVSSESTAISVLPGGSGSQRSQSQSLVWIRTTYSMEM
jgi:hypothetical protein